MARRNSLFDLGIAGIGIVINLLNIPLKILQAMDKQKMDNLKMERTRNLIDNTNHIMINRRSLIQSRRIMDDARLQRINTQALIDEEREARIAEIKARTELAIARKEQMQSLFGVNASAQQDYEGAVVEFCPDCGNTQSRALGNTCLACGATTQTMALGG